MGGNGVLWGLANFANGLAGAYAQSSAQAERMKFEKERAAQENFERTRQFQASQANNDREYGLQQQREQRQDRSDQENRSQFLASAAATPEAKVQVYQEGIAPGSQHIVSRQPGVGGRPGIMVPRDLSGPEAQAHVIAESFKTANERADRLRAQQYEQQLTLKHADDAVDLQKARIAAGAGAVTAQTKSRLANETATQNRWFMEREAESDPAKKAVIDQKYRALGAKHPIPPPIQKPGSQGADVQARAFENDLYRTQGELNKELASPFGADETRVEQLKAHVAEITNRRDQYLRQKTGQSAAPSGQMDSRLVDETMQRVVNAKGDHRAIESAIQQLAHTYNMDPDDVARMLLGE